MLSKIMLLCGICIFASAIALQAQTLDGAPYKAGVDADVDLYFSNGEDSVPMKTHGTLIEKTIFTKGDPMNPPAKGATLKYLNRFSFATLETGISTKPTALKGEQEMIYILSGTGSIKAKGGNKTELYSGMGVLIPAELEFTMTASGDEPLTMYLVCEPTPAGFRPNTELKFTDENTGPITSSNAHWTHIWKGLFGTGDGYGTLESTGTVTHDAMTIGHPHSHVDGVEEIWAEISGTSIAFIGKEIRMQPPGTAYMIPPDGKTPHCNINSNQDTQIKLLYIARYRDHEVRP